MTVSSQGLELQSGSRTWRAAVELLSSMRFAIALLTVICLASVIGTVLKQNEPLGNYINQFGPFWAQVFGAMSLYNVYSAWWFMVILGFLVVSTSLCVARNTPKIWVDVRSYKENIREQSLKAFGHRAQANLNEAPEAAARRMGELLVGGGWKVRLQQRDTPSGAGWMVAAKAGAANKLGYIAAHSAIVLVCLGGLMDGDLMVRAQMLFHGKTPFGGGGMLVDVPEKHRLGDSNPTFRGNLLVAEGTQSSTAILSQSDGIVLQELPFSVELKKFIVEYYATGMPKLFASDIVIHDKQTGEKLPARVEVNHPVHHRGVEIYQSSFDDGGSTVRVRAVPMHANGRASEFQGRIGGSTTVIQEQGEAAVPVTVEFTGLRVANVENFADAADSTVDVRKVDLHESIKARMGAANKVGATKHLRNVGPSISYKLRDAAGQAREFNNYMLPLDMGDGVPVFMLGMRDTLDQSFRYLRIPADEKQSMDAFLRLKAALADPAMRERAVQRYAAKSVDANRPELVPQLVQSATRVLTLFAQGQTTPSDSPQAGLQAVAGFIESNVPESERDRAGEVLIRILNGVVFELAQLSREAVGQQPAIADATSQAFMTLAVLALSDAPLYAAPVTLQLTDFTHVQASVFQVARAPGKNVVYLGCALLILGIFAMLYVRERRLWVWLAPADRASSVGTSGAQATMALSTNRKTMDGDREFEQLKTTLLGWKE